ncbi:MAG: porin, partial [Pirellulaceae bacterium]
NAGSAELLDEATDVPGDVTVNGFHVTFASFLTGETVRRREVVQPCRPFDPRFGCSQLGAFEPYFRYSYLKFDSSVFDQGFVDADLWTDEVSMTDIGINWYLNRHVKFYFDWQHAAYASPVLVNEDTGLFSTFNDTFWARCQFYF